MAYDHAIYSVFEKKGHIVNINMKNNYPDTISGFVICIVMQIIQKIYMTASAQITNTKIFAFIAVLVFEVFFFCL